jgi:hypothetical protein
VNGPVTTKLSVPLNLEGLTKPVSVKLVSRRWCR